MISLFFFFASLLCLWEKIDGALAEGVEALKLVLSKDFGESWRLFNVEQKYKHLRQHTIIAP